jgi:2-oxoglutarate dehydrogenase E2 component (dihydrolipoamide succinyltransferase)
VVQPRGIFRGAWKRVKPLVSWYLAVIVMDRNTVVMPRLGESIVEGTIVRWLVNAGDRVARGQILAEVETDKATSEIPSPSDGVVAERLVPEGETVEVGRPILRLGEAETKSDGRLPTKHLLPRGPIRSSPSVRRLAREHQIDLHRISGSGKAGRVTKSDVLKQLEQTSVPPPLPTADATPFPTQVPQPSAFRPPAYRPQREDEIIPFSRRREQIAEHMLYSLKTSAHVFAVAEIDMGHVQRAKDADAPQASKSGVSLTFLPYVVASVAKALGEHPSLNATVVERSVILRREKNIGVAVDTEEGLVVPVVHRADELGLLGIARRIQELAEKARAGKLSPDDIANGSFTISNPGRRGNLFGVSIIRQPEVAILRVGALVKRPVVREIEGEDVIVVRPMMIAALSYDHRVIDGRTANDFLFRLTELLQSAVPLLR